MNEVIIDDCNVIECEFYDDLECNAYRQEYWEPQDNTKDLCKCHPDCYFKQLQRLKDKSEKVEHRFKQTKKANKQYKIDIKNLQAENTQLKTLLENKEKAYNYLCNANSRKKEQIKNLNFMLFEEKDMTTQEWKLKYRLANKERKFIQYKEITNKRLNEYKKSLEDIREFINNSCKGCTAECDCVICSNYTLKEKIDKILNNK